MYKLYYMRGSCSLAIRALMIDLGLKFEAINKDDVNFAEISPTGAVPIIEHDGLRISEGAAIALYLLENNENTQFPKNTQEKAKFVEWLMLANATIHPAYSKLFHSAKVLEGDAQKQFQTSVAQGLNKYWGIVDAQLAQTPFVTGDKPSIVDMMLAVYANWTQFFDVEVQFGSNTKRMFKAMAEYPAFKQALEAEDVPYKAAA